MLELRVCNYPAQWPPVSAQTKYWRQKWYLYFWNPCILHMLSKDSRFEFREFRSCKVWKGSAENWFFWKQIWISEITRISKNLYYFCSSKFVWTNLGGHCVRCIWCSSSCKAEMVLHLFSKTTFSIQEKGTSLTSSWFVKNVYTFFKYHSVHSGE